MKIVHGLATEIRARHSEVILHVPEGVYGIILGNVYSTLWRLSHLVRENDTVISPMCEFELHSYMDIPKGAWYKIQVPHIVNNIAEARDQIRVKYQDKHGEFIDYAEMLLPEEGPPVDSVNVYYRLCHRHVEIFTPHFSQFIVYAKNTPIEQLTTIPEPINCCTRGAEMLVFTKMMTEGELLELSVYLCSSHYPDRDYKQVKYFSAKVLFLILTFSLCRRTHITISCLTVY